MTSTNEMMSFPPPRPRLQCPPPPFILEIPNFPYVVLRELLPMLDTSSKRTLRLVSHSLRDLIDTQKNFQFNVTLSDDTSSTVLRFNQFDFEYLPRVLHHLQVTTLLAPLKIFSTSVSRCPLPPQIQILEFSDTRGISQDNFLKLLNFYGRANNMKKLKVNMLALEKVEEASVVRQGLKLTFLEDLELTFPDTTDADIRFPRLLLGGVFPTLQTLSVNLCKFGAYYPILYKDFHLFLGRNLASLKNVEVIHPSNYLEPSLHSLARNRSLSPLGLVYIQETPLFAREIAKIFDLQPSTRATFQEQCDASRVTKLSMTIPRNESIKEQLANFGMTFLQAQKCLVDLELYNFPISEESCQILAQLIQNCSSSLVTLKLVQVVKAKVTVGDVFGHNFDDEENDANDIHFNLTCVGLCSKLKTFVFTCEDLDGLGVAILEIELPENGLENLVWPGMNIQHLEEARGMLTELKSFEFQGREWVSLEQIQILLGDEGFPSLERVTMFPGQWEWRRIRDWTKGRGMQKPLRDVTITKTTEVDRFTGCKVKKIVLSRAPLK